MSASAQLLCLRGETQTLCSPSRRTAVCTAELNKARNTLIPPADPRILRKSVRLGTRRRKKGEMNKALTCARALSHTHTHTHTHVYTHKHRCTHTHTHTHTQTSFPSFSYHSTAAKCRCTYRPIGVTLYKPGEMGEIHTQTHTIHTHTHVHTHTHTHSTL